MVAQFDPTRPRRSALYMPGANARALEKARTLDADTLLFDLEDAVAPDAKQMAREQVRAAVRSGGYGAREIIVRVNGLQTPWGADDLAAIKGIGVDGVLIPKVNAPRDLDAAAERVAEEALWAMMETPAGIGAAYDIARHPRLHVLVAGTNDLAKELHAAHVPGRAPLQTALQLVLLAARSAGRGALDGVFNAIDDTDGFAAECMAGRDFGFDGKTLIHPSQIAPCNAIFAPTPAAIAEARTIIAAFEAPEAKGVTTVNGKMVELLHVEDARRLVARAEAIDARKAGA